MKIMGTFKFSRVLTRCTCISICVKTPHKWKFLESRDAQIGHFSDASTKEHKYSEIRCFEMLGVVEMLGVLETLIGRILISK